MRSTVYDSAPMTRRPIVPHRVSAFGVCVLTSWAFLSCNHRSSHPTGSYTFPAAVLGIPVQSPHEAAEVRTAVAQFSEHHHLKLYRRKDEPVFAMDCSSDPQHCADMYIPTPPGTTHGFSVELTEFSRQCFMIQFLEQSGSWTQPSLDSLSELQRRLMGTTRVPAQLFVHPKRQQNWPEQNEPNTPVDPERPTYLKDLCARLPIPQF